MSVSQLPLGTSLVPTSPWNPHLSMYITTRDGHLIRSLLPDLSSPLLEIFHFIHTWMVIYYHYCEPLYYSTCATAHFVVAGCADWHTETAPFVPIDKRRHHIKTKICIDILRCKVWTSTPLLFYIPPDATDRCTGIVFHTAMTIGVVAFGSTDWPLHTVPPIDGARAPL